MTDENRNRIEQLREATKLTHDELGEVVGDSGSAIERYEAGEAIPPDVAQKLAAAFGVSLPFLRGEE
jgi:transcriptional regulator with XRE-family HTH domain